ncbi:MAG: UPF0149 family protein [Idiomarina sp.]|nr:UPF0149 family protein [Idiomarina sp.]
MTDNASRAFEQLTQWLEQEDMIVSAAELHGMLTGLLASGQRAHGGDWLLIVADLANEGNTFSSRMNQQLETLAKEIREGLGCPELSFQPLLPGDEEALTERLSALTEWTQCFLVGFGVNQQNLAKASEDLREAIQDMAEIARLSPDVNAGEDDERAFYEVCEYVRISAIMCFNELGNMPPPASPASQSIH